eukprot:TRINITY_DN246_c0_g1_i1.p1 TRINITY_DN246_c0_g1~~TRINITY_DN246_c0_g1_i1.p1  ORF type:complete len:156 (+),score=53.21 TRINITY_DN246_c0_g1_i1:51-470(+)
MKVIIVALVVLLAVVSVLCAPLDGTWRGHEESKRPEGDYEFTFDGANLSTKGPHLPDNQKATFTAVADAKPYPTIDITWRSGQINGNVSLGIWQLTQGNKLLRIAISRPDDKTRPTDFIPRPDEEDRIFDLLHTNATMC